MPPLNHQGTFFLRTTLMILGCRLSIIFSSSPINQDRLFFLFPGAIRSHKISIIDDQALQVWVFKEVIKVPPIQDSTSIQNHMLDLCFKGPRWKRPSFVLKKLLTLEVMDCASASKAQDIDIELNVCWMSETSSLGNTVEIQSDFPCLLVDLEDCGDTRDFFGIYMDVGNWGLISLSAFWDTSRST